jgi:hypothetical protein
MVEVILNHIILGAGRRIKGARKKEEEWNSCRSCGKRACTACGRISEDKSGLDVFHSFSFFLSR